MKNKIVLSEKLGYIQTDDESLRGKKSTFGVIDNSVMDDKRLSKDAKLAYVSLICFRNQESNKCFPGRKALANKVGFSTRTIDKGLKELEELSYIKIKHRYNNNKKQYYSNNYVINDCFNKNNHLKSSKVINLNNGHAESHITI